MVLTQLKKDFDFEKILNAITEFSDSEEDFCNAHDELFDFVNDVQMRLSKEKCHDNARITELESQFSETPAERLTYIEKELKKAREKARGIVDHYDPVAEGKVRNLEQERDRLSELVRKSFATPEERELANLREKTYSPSPEEKIRFGELYERADKAHCSLIKAQNLIVNESKTLSADLEKNRSAVVKANSVDMGQQYIYSAKKDFDRMLS